MENEIRAEGVPMEIAEARLSLTRDPKAVLAEAIKASKALAEVIAMKKNPVVLNGEQYLEFEDWSTVARFYGVASRIVSTTPLEEFGFRGFAAVAEAVHLESGRIVGRAEAQCTDEEDRWNKRAKYDYVNGKRTKIGEEKVPLFQLKAMAQTRAGSRALKALFSWVAVLAGYNPTPAEEMTGNEEGRKPPPPPVQQPRRASEAPKATPPAAPTEGTESPKDAPPPLKSGSVAEMEDHEVRPALEGVIQSIAEKEGKPFAEILDRLASFDGKDRDTGKPKRVSVRDLDFVFRKDAKWGRKIYHDAKAEWSKA